MCHWSFPHSNIVQSLREKKNWLVILEWAYLDLEKFLILFIIWEPVSNLFWCIFKNLFEKKAVTNHIWMSPSAEDAYNNLGKLWWNLMTGLKTKTTYTLFFFLILVILSKLLWSSYIFSFIFLEYSHNLIYDFINYEKNIILKWLTLN